MMERALARRAREARNWLFDACFPLWAEQGFDRNVFCEALDMSHRPLEGLTSARVRVQARQTYVFATAARLGWRPELSVGLAETGLDVLTRLCRREDGLFGRVIDIETGGLGDDTADLYDTAFALFAAAHLPPSHERSVLVSETLTAIETHLKDEASGYIEHLPRPAYRLQNPHMHFFEALLALCEADQDPSHLTPATDIHNLCLEHFIDARSGALGERFERQDWRRPEGEAGDVVEPGHQFEWVWLMGEYARLAGTDLPEQANGLYEFACSTLDREGRAVQSCDRKGQPVDASRRTWPQTEALKAHLLRWHMGDQAAGARAIASFDILMDEYLTPEGGWIDHYDAEGHVIAPDMPASTGYHVVLAFSNLISTLET